VAKSLQQTANKVGCIGKSSGGKLATIGVAGGKLERTMFVFRCEGFQTAAKVKRSHQFLLLLLPLFFDYLHFYQIYFLNGIVNSSKNKIRFILFTFLRALKRRKLYVRNKKYF
jgi:hypothetical protein